MKTLLFLGILFLLAACGPSVPAATPLPSVTPLPTFVYIAPTEAPQVVAVGESTLTAVSTPSGAALDPQKVEAGKGRYTALECGSCHGDDGKGTAKGSSLIGIKLTEDDFINVLRSGGKMGNDHQYSSNRLSDTGARNLYQYILSLNAAK
jgi:mono/diheme cytochrome c family protein